MSDQQQPSILKHFTPLTDPRIDRKKLYSLNEILFVILCGSLCGAQSWRDFVTFGEEKIKYLSRFLPFDNGVPSKNTFSRVLSSLDPGQFKECFISWVKSFQLAMDEVIAIDGKCLRRSFDKASEQPAMHMVSAFATHAKLVLGQQRVDDKSNEITAIPKLLDLLALGGTTVTIDAMGTQKKIAQKIREKKGDYVLALKGNHSCLHDDIRLFLSSEINEVSTSTVIDQHEEYDKGHCRIERRICYASDHLDWLQEKEEWRDLKTIAMVESQVTVGDKTTTERRYFISSLPADAQRIARAVRSHWAIENCLHWVVDVTMDEDQSRVRKDHAPENMAMIRHITLNMLQNMKKTFKDMSIACRKKPVGGDSTLSDILMQQFEWDSPAHTR